MMIRKAEGKDIAAVANSYEELFAYEAVHGSTTNWLPGKYPAENTAQTALDNGWLYVLEEAGFGGSMILNQVQPEEYQRIDWQYPADPAQVLVIHTLCIPPAQAGRGYGRQLVRFALKKAQQDGCRVLRLDTWAGNHPAASLYTHLGFRLAGTAPMLLQGLIPEQQVFFERKVAD